MSLSPILGATDLVEAQAVPETSENERGRRFEQGGQQFNVKDKDLAAPPVSPADGDAYIVAASPTGAWTGQAKSIAYWQSGTGWLFIAPRTGFRAEVNDEALVYRYDGAAWAATTGSVIASATLTASETIAAGLFVQIYSSSGVKIRKANATDDTKPCDGYAPAAIANTASGTIYGPGTKISGLSGLTPGADVWLDTTGGGWTHTPPSGAGNLVQKLGKAVSATEVFFNPQSGVTL